MEISRLYPGTLVVGLINVDARTVVDCLQVFPGLEEGSAAGLGAAGVGTGPVPRRRPPGGRPASRARQGAAADPRQAQGAPGLDPVGLARIYFSGGDIAASLSEPEVPLIRLLTTTGATLTLCTAVRPYVVVVYANSGQEDLGDADLDRNDAQLMRLAGTISVDA